MLNSSHIAHRISDKYNAPIRTLRNLEKFNHKIIKIQCNLSFLNKCLHLGLMPKFIKDPNLLLTDELQKSRQIKKINQLNKCNKTQLRTLSRLRINILDDLSKALSNLDSLVLHRILTKINP